MFKKTLIKGQGSFWENFKFVLRIKKYVDNDPIFINRIFAHYVIRCAERMLKRVAYLVCKGNIHDGITHSSYNSYSFL